MKFAAWSAMTHEQRRAVVARRNGAKIRARERAAYRADAAWRKRKIAGVIVHRAIKYGKLERGPCEHAGPDCDGPIEAHHEDYDKPLDVRWLCAEHHRREHRA